MNPLPNSRKAWHLDLGAGAPTPADPYCIGVGEKIQPEALLNLVVDQRFAHVCQRDGHLFSEEMRSAEKMIESPDDYFEYPISTILSPQLNSAAHEESLISFDQTFNSSAQKLSVIGALNSFMQSRSVPQTIADDVTAVADELYTNAIFNAPFVDMHTHKNPGVSRNSLQITLEEGRHARLFYAHDAKRIIIGCADPYGSLNLVRYLTKIRTTYQRGPAAAINFGPGGAGIGSYIIFNAGSSLYFGVRPGRLTLLCCVVPVGISNRKRLQLSKHIHWLQR